MFEDVDECTSGFNGHGTHELESHSQRGYKDVWNGQVIPSPQGIQGDID
jgi:hypothetical protein